MEVFAFVVLVMWFVFAFLGLWIASTKGRSEGEGWVLGFLFGPLGCLIEAVLPTIASTSGSAPAPATPQSAPDPARVAYYQAQADQARAKREAAEQRELQRLADLAELARIEAATIRNAARKRLQDRGINPDSNPVVIWFQLLPDLAQAIMAGLAFGGGGVVLVVLIFRHQI